jgi:hypothetical protein
MFLLSVVLAPTLTGAVTTPVPQQINFASQEDSYLSNLAFCPGYPSNPNTTLVANIINQTSSENMLGACALAALSFYNASGVLRNENITVNLTELNEQYLLGNPNLTITNTTVISNLSHVSFCIMTTPPSHTSANSTAERVHIHKCTPGWLRHSIQVNITFPNTTNGTIEVNISGNTTALSKSSRAVSSIDPSSNSTSPSWAGYLATANLSSGSVFTDASGSWIVQKAWASPASRSSAQWVGIGGYGSALFEHELVQAGTDSCFNSNNTNTSACPFSSEGPHYWAFVEELPAEPFKIPLTLVQPGDLVKAAVTVIGLGGPLSETWFQIQIINKTSTQDRTLELPYAYPTLLPTAEVIDERPVLTSLTSPSIYLGLTNFINATFLSGSAITLFLTSLPINRFPNTLLTMVDSLNTPLANVTISTSNDSFRVNNFRVSKPAIGSPHNITIQAGESVPIPVTAYGGTGSYTFMWLARKALQLNYSRATNCIGSYSYISGNYSTYVCNFTTTSSTPSGVYELMAEVQDDNISNETIYSAPVNITVLSSKPQVPVTLHNTQPMAVLSNTPVMVNVDSEHYSKFEEPSLLNVNWTYANGTIIPAWIELNGTSNATDTVYWLKLAPGIPPNGNMTVFLDFANVSRFNASTVSPSNILVAYSPLTYPNLGIIFKPDPCLSSPSIFCIGGSAVFNYYTEFQPSIKLPPASGWQMVVTKDPNSTQDPIPIYRVPTLTGSNIAFVNISSASQYGIVTEFYGNMYNVSSNCSGPGSYFGMMSGNNITGFLPESETITENGTHALVREDTLQSIGYSDYNSSKVYSIASYYPEEATFLINYTPIYTAFDFRPQQPSAVGFYIPSCSPRWNPTTMTFQWFDTRTMPPDDIMPVASFGS